MSDWADGPSPRYSCIDCNLQHDKGSITDTLLPPARWLRTADVGLQQLLLSLLERAGADDEEEGAREEEEAQDGERGDSGAPGFAGMLLDLSALGAAGKVGKTGTAALAGILNELRKQQEERDADGRPPARVLVRGISLQQCDIDGAGACAVVAAAAGLRGLTDLDLSCNALGSAGASATAGKGGKAGSTSPRDTGGVGAASAEDLGKVLAGCTELLRLGLARVGFSDEGCAEILTRVARQRGPLAHLDLSGNQAGPAAAKALASALASNPRLVAVRLADSAALGASATDAEPLARALLRPQPLAQLDLSGCALGAAAARALADLVGFGGSGLSAPAHLSLTGNALMRGGQAARALAAAVSGGVLKGCRGLSLAWNGGGLPEASIVLTAFTQVGERVAASRSFPHLSASMLAYPVKEVI